jgi:hypothetical protein
VTEPDVVTLHKDIAEDSSDTLHGLNTKSIDAILTAALPQVERRLQGEQTSAVELERESGELSDLLRGHGEAVVVEKRVVVGDATDTDEVGGGAHGQQGRLDLGEDSGVQQQQSGSGIDDDVVLIQLTKREWKGQDRKHGTGHKQVGVRMGHSDALSVDLNILQVDDVPSPELILVLVDGGELPTRGVGKVSSDRQRSTAGT